VTGEKRTYGDWNKERKKETNEQTKRGKRREEKKERKVKIKVKVKLSLCLTKHHAMKTYRESGGIAPRILDLGTRRR
jgi:hypothetical protein